MPTSWDLLPASAWPVQPFIPPFDPTQAPWPQPAPMSWENASAKGPAQPASPATSVPDASGAPAAGANGPGQGGGILGPYAPNQGGGILGQFAPPGGPVTMAARAAATAPELPPWLLPLGLTGAAAAAFLLGSTTRTARAEDDEFHPQYVVRGGPSSPPLLQRNTNELTPIGLPGQHGMSSTSAPNMSVDQLAGVARYPNAEISYTIVPELNGLGYRVEPTPSRANPLHASILLPPGQTELSDEQAKALSTLFRIERNPYRTPRR